MKPHSPYDVTEKCRAAAILVRKYYQKGRNCSLFLRSLYYFMQLTPHRDSVMDRLCRKQRQCCVTHIPLALQEIYDIPIRVIADGGAYKFLYLGTNPTHTGELDEDNVCPVEIEEVIQQIYADMYNAVIQKEIMS